MQRKKVTCPVSAHLEEIEFSEDPCTGAILNVVSCSAHAASGELACRQLCATLLNRGLRRRTSEELPVPAIDLEEEPPEDEGPHGGRTDPDRFTPRSATCSS